MRNMTDVIVRDGLRRTGERLAARGSAPIQIILCGAVAGILGGDLAGDRQTLDCDVIVSDPKDQFSEVAASAAVVAGEMDLKPEWLNAESRHFAYLLPRGWRNRLVEVGRFGPLDVLRIDRRDLMALKLMSFPKRPQDLQDIQAMQPTADDIAFLTAYLDEREAESLDRETFELQRSIVDELRSRT